MLRLESAVYAFDKENPPAGRCVPGEEVCFVTQDCFGGQVKGEGDLVRALDWNRTNPAAGPLFVEGAQPGDALKVTILDIQVGDTGVVATMEEGGALWEGHRTLRTREVTVQDGMCSFLGLRFPAQPMIGVIGTAPAGSPLATAWSSPCGGNMDSRVIQKGAVVYLPVQVPGALLALGDLHAVMGDGEVCETGAEITGEVTLRVDLIKNCPLNWPVTETARHWFVNTNGTTCDIALRRGYEELHRLVMAVTGWDGADAALYLSLRARVAANQAVLDAVTQDEQGVTFRVGIPKDEGLPPLISDSATTPQH